MNIIEITGVPCAGKSTIIDLLGKYPQFTLFDQKWLLSNLRIKSNSRIINTITYEAYMFSCGFFCATPKMTLKFFLEVMKLNEPLVRRINIFRNIVHKYAIHHRASKLNLNGCLLVDEGISHIPYLFTGGLTKKNETLFLKFPKNTEPRIIKLTMNLETIIKRLQQRGHKRIDYDTSYSYIREFAVNNEQCSNLQSKMLKEYNNVVYLNLSAEDMTKEIEESLLQNLNECISQSTIMKSN